MNAIKVIEVFPKEGDNWELNPPILDKPTLDTEDGYLFSTKALVSTNLFSTKILNGYLLDLEETSSEIDFVTQTRVKVGSDKSELNGVGGITNLKDFKFALVRKLIDLKLFIGCTIKLWEVFPDTNTKKLKMVAQIDSGAGNPSRVEFTVKGKFSLNEAQLTVDGSPIMFGKTSMIKLEKRKDDFGNTRLIFNPTKYSIKSILVKAKRDEFTRVNQKPLLLPVSTNFNIIDDEIIFSSLAPNDVTVYSTVMKPSARGSVIFVQDVARIIVKFELDSLNTSPPQCLSWSKNTFIRYYLESSSTDVYGKSYALYKTDGYGCYESVISDIVTNGSLTSVTPSGSPTGENASKGTASIDVITFLPIVRPRIPVSPIFYSGESMGVWLENNNPYYMTSQGAIMRTLPTQRQIVTFRMLDGTYTVNKIVYEQTVSDTGEVFFVTALVIESGPNPLPSSILQGTKISIYTQDSTADYVDLLLDCPLIDTQNFTSNMKEIREGSGTVRTYSMYGLDFLQSDSYVGYGASSLLFDIPSLDGTVREPIFSGSFSSQTQEVSVEDYRAISTVRISSVDGVYGSRISNHDVSTNSYKNIYELSRVLQINKVQEIAQGQVSWGLWNSTPEQGQPVTLANWKDLSFSLSYEVLTKKDFSREFFTFSHSNCNLNFIVELSIEGNDFYAEVDDLLPYRDQVTPDDGVIVGPANLPKKLSLLSDQKVLVLAKQTTGFWWAHTVSYQGGNLGWNITGTTVLGTDDNQIIVKDRQGNIGLLSEGRFYPYDGSLIDVLSGGVAPVTINLVDRDGLVQTDEFYLSVDDSIWLKIWFKKGMTDPANPVTLAYSILTREGGFKPEYFVTQNWIDTALKRDGWKHSYVTTSTVSAMSAASKVLKEAGLILYENKEGLIEIIDLTPPEESTVTKVIDSTNLFIRDGSVGFDYDEEFLPLGYLVSSLDIYYDIDEGTEYGKIPSDSFPDQRPFILSKSYLADKKKEYRMKLDTVSDYSTALKVGELNMLFHAVPGRFLSFNTIDLDFKIGEWVKINSSLLPGTTGSLYIVLGEQSQGFVTKVNVFEFDIDSITDVIQEVPYPSETSIYYEDTDTSEMIQEVLP